MRFLLLLQPLCSRIFPVRGCSVRAELSRVRRENRRSSRHVPAAEALEARIAPAAVVAALVDGPDKDHVFDTLSIQGTSHGDTVTITDDPATGTISIAAGKLNRSFSTAALERVVIALGSGNDRLTYTLAGLDGAARDLDVNLGSGSNALDFSAGLLENDASLPLRVTGGSGSDAVAVTFGEIAAGAKVTLTENLGGGIDPSSLNFNGSITDEGTLVIANINLGTGSNEWKTNFRSDDGFFLYNGATLKETVIGSTRAKDHDTVRAFLSGQVSDFFSSGALFTYDALLGAGNDTSSFGIDYNATTEGIVGPGVIAYGGRIHIGMQGGGGNDSLLVNHNLADGTASIGGSEAFIDGSSSSSGSLLEIALTGGVGNDAVGVDFGGGGFEINAGAVLRIQAVGDQGFDDPLAVGTDTVSVTVEAASDSEGGRVDLLVRGDDGDDNLTLTFTDHSGTATQSGLASINTEADGGAGDDLYSGNARLVLRCP